MANPCQTGGGGGGGGGGARGWGGVHMLGY